MIHLNATCAILVYLLLDQSNTGTLMLLLASKITLMEASRVTPSTSPSLGYGSKHNTPESPNGWNPTPRGFAWLMIFLETNQVDFSGERNSPPTKRPNMGFFGFSWVFPFPINCRGVKVEKNREKLMENFVWESHMEPMRARWYSFHQFEKYARQDWVIAPGVKI